MARQAARSESAGLFPFHVLYLQCSLFKVLYLFLLAGRVFRPLARTLGRRYARQRENNQQEE